MNTKKRLIKLAATIVCAALTASIFTACKAPVDIDKQGAASATLQEFPVVVNEITINTKPTKVAVLSGSVADVILAMGCETSLALASEDCVQPELQALPKVPGTEIQGVAAAGVDLVIANTFTEEQRAAFTEAGIPAIHIDHAKNREDFERMYAQIGSALNGAGTGYNKGIDSAQKIFTTLDDLSRIIPTTDKVTTGCFVFDLTSSAVTGDMLGSTLLSYAGITNVFQGATGGTYEFEKLKVTNPDYIFCPTGLKAKMKADANFSKLHAVQENKVYEVSDTFMNWEGRTAITAATYFAGVAYPELLEETSASVTLPEVVEPSPSAAVPTENSKPEASVAPTKNEVTYDAIAPGTDGEDVLKMQKRLADLGYLTVEYTGMYGDVTSEAIKAFQKKSALSETGEADSKTLSALYAEDAPKAK